MGPALLAHSNTYDRRGKSPHRPSRPSAVESGFLSIQELDMPITNKERMQVAAFHTIYKTLRRQDSGYQERKKHQSREEDFCEAIVVTSDDRMKDTDPLLIEQWLATYDKKGSRAKKRQEETLLKVEGFGDQR